MIVFPFSGEFPFDFVFLIRLRNESGDRSLTEIITDEHDRLTEMDKTTIRLLLEGKVSKKCFVAT